MEMPKMNQDRCCLYKEFRMSKNSGNQLWYRYSYNCE